MRPINFRPISVTHSFHRPNGPLQCYVPLHRKLCFPLTDQPKQTVINFNLMDFKVPLYGTKSRERKRERPCVCVCLHVALKSHPKAAWSSMVNGSICLFLVNLHRCWWENGLWCVCLPPCGLIWFTNFARPSNSFYHIIWATCCRDAFAYFLLQNTRCSSSSSHKTLLHVYTVHTVSV